ncbi:hypothetical protein [Paenibacillus maysiensis]|uniref:hypothetical protein n=1 Tax=Paenibacillus maysiensis TaxID=1155954 RepID=UPI003CC91F12
MLWVEGTTLDALLDHSSPRRDLIESRKEQGNMHRNCLWQKESIYGSQNGIFEVIVVKHTYKVLKTDRELFGTALVQAHVYVVSIDEELRVAFEDYGGVVEEIKPESVKTVGKIFMREQLEFRIDLVSGEDPG